MRSALLAFLGSVALITGCGIDDDDGGSRSSSADAVPKGAFLKPSDFDPENLVPLSAGMVESEIRSSFIFQNREMPEGQPALEGFTRDCGEVASELDATKDSLTVVYVNDGQRCDGGIASNVKIFARFGCLETSLEEAVSDLRAVDLVRRDRWRFCPTDSRQTILFNMDLVASGTRQGKKATARAFGIWMGRDGGACKYEVKDGRVSVDGCTFRVNGETTVIQETDKTERRTEMHQVFDLEGLAGPANDKYYDEGRIAITVNDWTGEMLYSTTANPSYSVSNGSETVQGTFVGSFGLREAVERLEGHVAAEIARALEQ